MRNHPQERLDDLDAQVSVMELEVRQTRKTFNRNLSEARRAIRRFRDDVERLYAIYAIRRHEAAEEATALAQKRQQLDGLADRLQACRPSGGKATT